MKGVKCPVLPAARSERDVVHQELSELHEHGCVPLVHVGVGVRAQGVDDQSGRGQRGPRVGQAGGGHPVHVGVPPALLLGHKIQHAALAAPRKAALLKEKRDYYVGRLFDV